MKICSRHSSASHLNPKFCSFISSQLTTWFCHDSQKTSMPPINFKTDIEIPWFENFGPLCWITLFVQCHRLSFFIMVHIDTIFYRRLSYFCDYNIHERATSFSSLAVSIYLIAMLEFISQPRLHPIKLPSDSKSPQAPCFAQFDELDMLKGQSNQR